MAQQDTIDKIINIQFKYSELVEGVRLTRENIGVLNASVSQFKNEIKSLEKAIEAARKVYLDENSTNGERIKARENLIRLSKELRTAEDNLKKAERESIAQKKSLQERERQYSKELQNNIKIETEATNSINQLQANVSKLTAQYNALSGAAREGDAGKRLAADIKSQQTAINEAKAALGDYRSQVGSYEEALRAVLPAEASQLVTLGKTIDKSGGVTKAFGFMTAAIGRMAKAAWAFISTPLGAALTAISIVTALVVKNWDKLKDTLGITDPVKEASEAIEKLNKQLDRLKDKAESANTAALKKYTEAIRQAKGDIEELTKAHEKYKEELLATELERAKIALSAADKADQIAFKAYQNNYKNEDIEKAHLEAKKAREAAAADVARIENEIEKNRAEKLSEDIENTKKTAREKTEIAEKFAVSERKIIENNAIKLNELRDKRQQEVYKSVVATQAEIIRGLKDMDKEWADEVLDHIESKQQEYQNRILQAQVESGFMGAQEAQIHIANEVVDVLQQQVDEFDNLKIAYEAMGKSAAEIDGIRLELILQLQKAQNDLQAAQYKSIITQREETYRTVNIASQAAGSLANVFEQLGGESEKYAQFAKSMAIMQVVLSESVAIAKAWEGNAGLPFPANIIATAASVAAIVAAIASALSSTKSTEVPKYASGGLVSGPGTGTSDSIPAMLSNGEAVMTAKAVNDWGAVLSAMNVSSGGNAINVSNLPQRGDGMRGMERMMERVLLNLPNPIVLVKDIDTGQRRVKVATNLGKLGGNRKK